jgi:hypothetical protein
MSEPASRFAALLTEAEQIAATGPISPAGRWAYRGIAAAVAELPPGLRRAAIWAALGRLAEDDPAVALHGLAQMLRVTTDAMIQATSTRRPRAS